MAKKVRGEEIDDALRRVADRLRDLAVPWAIIGGIAVSMRGEPRYTRDLDIAVAVDGDDAAEGVVFALTKGGYVVNTMIEQARAGRLATVRLVNSKQTHIFVDLLFASAGIEQEVAAAAEPVELLPGLVVPVARTGHLIALKILSESDTRLQDRIDLQVLGAIATAADWKLARAALVLIRKRGYHRDKPLLRLLGGYKRRARR